MQAQDLSNKRCGRPRHEALRPQGGNMCSLLKKHCSSWAIPVSVTEAAPSLTQEKGGNIAPDQRNEGNLEFRDL